MERWLLLLFQRTWVGFSAPTLGSSWLSITLSLKDPVPSGTHCIALTLREIPLPMLYVIWVRGLQVCTTMPGSGLPSLSQETTTVLHVFSKSKLL